MFPTATAVVVFTMWHHRLRHLPSPFGLFCKPLLRRLFGVLAVLMVFAHANGQSASTVEFGTVAVGTTSQPVQVTLQVSQAGAAGSLQALTSGVPALDFTIADSGTCGGLTVLSAGQSCTLKVVFKPLYPGLRRGAVVLSVAGNTGVLASAPLTGVGKGSLPVLMPGQIDTVAGSGQWVYRGDGVAATAAPIFLPTGLAVDGAGNLYLSDSNNNRVRRVDAVTGLISTVAGNGVAGFAGDGGAATAAQLNTPAGLCLDGAGNLYVADSANDVVRRVDAVSGLITTVAGVGGVAGYGGDAGPATRAKLLTPEGLAFTPSGDLLIADTANSAIRLVDMSTGVIRTVAGTGVAGFNGDGGPAITAQLSIPWGVAVRQDGAIAIADMSNYRVRLIDTAGVIHTVAGDGNRGFSGDDDLASSAELNGPAAVAFDPAGDLFIADAGNNRVRLVSGTPAKIRTISGTSNQEFTGDGGPAGSAGLYGPYALYFGPAGDLWIADMFHNRVRQIHGSLLTVNYPTMKVGKLSAPYDDSIFNGGNAALDLAAPVLNESALAAADTTCGEQPIDPSASCVVGVEFAPTEVGQSVQGSASFPSDAPNVTPVLRLSGQVLSVEPATVGLTADLNPGLLGAPVTFTATVVSADTHRSGTVNFGEGTQVWCTAVPLAADGTAQCAVASLSLGTHTFFAFYSGDDSNASAKSPLYTETIKQQPALALSTSSSPSVVTSTIVLTLVAADQNGVPTGTVTFYDGSTPLGSAPLTSQGTASWSTQTLGVGAHSLTAQYSGDAFNVAATSNAAAEEITQASTNVLLSLSSSQITVGSSLSLSATVASAIGLTPTGSVTFNDGSTVLGTVNLSSSGTATFTTDRLAPGTRSLTATYSGDVNNRAGASTPIKESVLQIGTSTTLSADAVPLNAGGTLHLSSVVTNTSGAMAASTLTGTVTFIDGTTVLGTAAVDAGGHASLAVPGLAVGSHALAASYSGTQNFASSTSDTLNETVQQTTTQTTLTVSAKTITAGDVSTLDVSVSSATGTPTGSVRILDGSSALGSVVLDASGHATLSTSKLSVGTHLLSAAYDGDVNYKASASAATNLTVHLAQPLLTLSSASSTLEAGATAQITATLVSSGVSPTGTLSLLDGKVVVATQPLAAGKDVRFSLPALSVGQHTLSASYSGDANNASAISAELLVTVTQSQTSVAVATSSNPALGGSPVTLSASVIGGTLTATGQVQWMDGTATLGTTALDSAGRAVLTVSSLALGRHTLQVMYTGDVNHTGSVASLDELIVQNASVALSSSLNPSNSGQPVVFSVHVSGGGASAPTGLVALKDGGVLLASVPLDAAAAATYSTTGLNVGTHSITAEYGGDGNFAAVSAQMIQTVLNASTQVTIAASANPGTYGTPLTLRAAISSNGGVATGQVTFTDGGTPLGTATLDGQATAVLTTSSLAPGVHLLAVSYAGDRKASASASTPLQVSVKQKTGLNVTADTNPALTLQPLTFHVAVSPTGPRAATGSVTLVDGTTNLGVLALDASGRGSLTVTGMSAGSHTLLASYAGDDANFDVTSPALNEVVQLRSTSVTVSGSSTNTAQPQQVTLVAVVKSSGPAPPGGTVTFSTGSVTMGVATVDSTGVATLTVILNSASVPVLATYSGDAAYAASSSGVTNIAAGKAPQFTLSMDRDSFTLQSRQHTTVQLTITSVKAFADTINLGCAGLPYAATCTFSKPSVKLTADGTVTVTVTVDTGNPLGAGAEASVGGGALLWGLPAMLSCLLLYRRTRRRLPTALIALVLLAMTAFGATGCGGLSVAGTPPGSYRFQVTGVATGAGTQEAQSLQMQVTQ